MKELSLEDVMRIAGGVPPASALDELTYRAPDPPDPADANARERRPHHLPQENP